MKNIRIKMLVQAQMLPSLVEFSVCHHYESVFGFHCAKEGVMTPAKYWKVHCLCKYELKELSCIFLFSLSLSNKKANSFGDVFVKMFLLYKGPFVRALIALFWPSCDLFVDFISKVDLSPTLLLAYVR